MKSIAKLLPLIILIAAFLSCEKEQIYDKLLLSKVYYNDELRQVYHYNENDLIDYLEHYHDNEIINKSIYFYNSANKISKIESMNSEEEITYELNYNYNQENKLIETVGYSFTSTNISRNKYAYNESGEIIADTLLSESGKINYYRTFEPINSKSYKTNFYSYNGKLSGDIIYEFDRNIDPKSYSTKMVEPDNCIKMSSSNEIDGHAIFEFEINNGQLDEPISDMLVIPLSSSSYVYNKSGYPTKQYTVHNSDPSKTFIISYEYIVP